jgi:spore maturation protein CgeB
VFEVPACGGLLLSERAPGLERYFAIGEEILVFESGSDLVRTIRGLLQDEPRRASIARAGFERTLRDHTWAQRLASIFREVGLLDDSGRPREGSVT